MGECSSLPHPPDLTLDQLERVKRQRRWGSGPRKGKERKELLSQAIGREFLQQIPGSEEGGFGLSCMCVGWVRGRGAVKGPR